MGQVFQLNDLTISLQCDWNFVRRVVTDTSQLFFPLEKMLEEFFSSNIQGISSITHNHRVLFLIAAKRGGLGAWNPVEPASLAFSTWVARSSIFDVNSVSSQERFE